MEGPPTTGLRVRRVLAVAWGAFPRCAPWILLLLLGWAGVWLLVEALVIGGAATPGRPLWLVLHVGYFLGTSFWEAAMLRVALDHLDGRRAAPRLALTDIRVALRFLIVKLILLPALLVGLAAGAVPGLYVVARFGLAPFYVVDRARGPWTALGQSGRATRGNRGRLMVLSLLLLLGNILGAALFGLGLIVTLPMTVLAGAHLFRVLDGAPR